MAVASLFEDLLDQYKLEERIAEKRYTDLYLAYDIDDDRPVWLDITRDRYANDSLFVGRFINRARALAQVRHPNINPVLHVGKASGGAPYVAQAAVDGYSLTHRLEQLARRETPANPLYALKLVRQLADALLLAERLEILHYDLQPDNILLKRVTLPTDDTVVLVDLFVPIEQNRHAVTEKGDPRRDYLSPEQRGGKEVTAASQVYSLGAILYRLLAGKMPDHSVTMGGTAFNRLFGRVTALERERPGLAPATYRLIDRSLRKDPRGRYPTIEAFVADLDSALAAEDLHLGATAKLAPSSRRPLTWLMPFLVLALFLSVGAVVMGNLRDIRTGIDAMGALPPASLAMTMTGEATAAATPPSIATGPPQPTTIAGAVAEQPSPTTHATDLPTEQSVTQPPEPSPTSSPTPEPTSTPTPEPEVPRVRVMHNLVNLRRGPGVAFASIGSVAGGKLLDVIAWNDDREHPWYLVTTEEGRIGWIAAEVVQAVNPRALASVPPAATLPAAPVPSATPGVTPSVVVIVTAQPTVDPGSGGSPSTPEEPPPTEQPTQPPVEPTSTPKPFPTDSPSP